MECHHTKGEGLKKLMAAWLVAALSIYLTSLILGGKMDFGGFWPVVITALVVGLMNYILAPWAVLAAVVIAILTPLIEKVLGQSEKSSRHS